MNDLLILSRKWSTGRGRYTSIERFCELLDPEFPKYFGERVHLPPQISGIFKSHTNSRVDGAFAAPYNSFSFELELWGLKKGLQNQYPVVFFPYADYDYYYFQYFRRMVHAKILLWSFFSVNELSRRFTNLRHFSKADLVLAAGTDQVHYLSNAYPEIRVGYFPIGVDTDFFIPMIKEKRSYRIVQVGANRRDFETLMRGLDQLWEVCPRFQIDIVGAYQARDQFPERPYLTLHSFVEDEQLRSILQRADFGILCLKDGGSSNSLLEMMACGLPVVVTDLENVRDYIVDTACLRIPKGDPQALVEGCRALIENDKLRERMSVAARLQAEKFSWFILKGKFDDILQQLMLR